tara:strand:+ start:19364 stop:20188 length:825 start_codon:yes stop_codon:yes gene_type:complete
MTDRKEYNTRSKGKNVNSDLTIQPIRPMEIKDKRKYHPNLPSINRNRGSLMLLIGSQNSGKTTIINNLLLSKHFWGGKESAFDAVYIFSPSIDLDDSCRFLREHFECYTEYKDEYLEEIKNRQKLYDKDKMPKIMIVADDSSGLLSRKFFHFLTRFRHYNANVILSIQNFKSLMPIARSNANAVILMNGVVNEKELEKINDEYGAQMKNTLLYMYANYANKPYSFLYLKLRKNPPEAFQNFKTPIKWKSLIQKARLYKPSDVIENEEIEKDEEI